MGPYSLAMSKISHIKRMSALRTAKNIEEILQFHAIHPPPPHPHRTQKRALSVLSDVRNEDSKLQQNVSHTFL